MLATCVANIRIEDCKVDIANVPKVPKIVPKFGNSLVAVVSR